MPLRTPQEAAEPAMWHLLKINTVPIGLCYEASHSLMIDDVLPGPRLGIREGPRKHVMIRWSDSHDRSLQLPYAYSFDPIRIQEPV